MDHVVERMLHGEIVQMKRERLIRITRCHVVESIMRMAEQGRSREIPEVP